MRLHVVDCLDALHVKSRHEARKLAKRLFDRTPPCPSPPSMSFT